MRIFHVATLADWQRAKASGTYTTSTYGASLEEVGYLHAARRDQVPGVLERFYSDVDEPILVLEIETDRLRVPWRQDPVDGERYPHVYGPLNTGAVVGYHPPSVEAFTRPRVPERPPTPPLTLAFQGIACMLGAACAIFFVAALVETSHNHHRLRPTAAPALLWTFTIVSGACFVIAMAVGETARWRHGVAAFGTPDGSRA